MPSRFASPRGTIIAFTGTLMNATFTECRLERADGTVLALPGSLTIGRAANNGLVLETGKASRRHASIHAQNCGEFWRGLDDPDGLRNELSKFPGSRHCQSALGFLDCIAKGPEARVRRKG